MTAVIEQYSIFFAKIVADGFHGMIRENVTLDIPEDYDVWPNGGQRPRHILCESNGEAGHYRLFKYEQEIKGSGFSPTGKNFGGVYDVYPR